MKPKNNSKSSNQKLNTFTISEKGSLGLLAFGDIGLRAWREVRDNTKRKNEKKA